MRHLKQDLILISAIWICAVMLLAVSLVAEETERQVIDHESDLMKYADDIDRIDAILACISMGRHRCQLIELDDRYLDGSDGSCLAAGMFLLSLFEGDPNLEQIALVNEGWVPSLHRLVDIDWARCLADVDPRQSCEAYDAFGLFDYHDLGRYVE